MGNRTFHADDWPTWFEEAERWARHPITDGPTVDRLYEHYLVDDTPLYALMALKVVERPTARVARQPFPPMGDKPTLDWPLSFWLKAAAFCLVTWAFVAACVWVATR